MNTESTGAVYFMTNATDGNNEIIMHRRMADGSLGMATAYATSGSGAGRGPMAPFADPLGSQSAIVMSDAHGLLFAVNAGSNDISAFRVQDSGLMLIDKISSGGNFPVSLAVHGDWLYALNAGGEGMLMGYSIQCDGTLMPMMGSLRSLNYGGKTPPFVFEAPGQIDFSPDGTRLVVIEKGISQTDQATHKIHVYKVDANGMVSEKAAISVSNGFFPFASTFTPHGQLLVVEAFGKGPVLMSTGAVTSYRIDANDCLKVISGTVDTLHNEACWIAQAGPYAYATNFADGIITGYRVAEDGSLMRLHDTGETMNTGMGSYPTDLAATPDGRFLYALLPGLKQVGVYAVDADGSLVSLGAAQGEWPVHIQGIVAR